MLVGADGIHSTVVKQIFDGSARPIFVNENIFYGIIDDIDQQTSIDSVVTTRNTLTQYFGFGEFLCYRAGNKGQFMWAATYPSATPPTNSDDAEWSEMNNQRDLTAFLRRFPSSHPVHQCAAATDSRRLLHFGLFYRQHRPDAWHRARICLLGDACHATLPYVGQGANMAIEDALVLALSLEKHHFQMEPAFQDYFHKRFDRTKRMVNMARYMGLFFHSENPLIHALRQRLIPWLIHSNLFIKLAEKEMYDHCPIPIRQKAKD
jgi:2-polyprenyl-6-methoxyphenol hydroxylase-like FAD-dependent oxidoreductase